MIARTDLRGGGRRKLISLDLVARQDDCAGRRGNVDWCRNWCLGRCLILGFFVCETSCLQGNLAWELGLHVHVQFSDLRRSQFIDGVS